MQSPTDLADLRRETRDRPLNPEDLAPDPMAALGGWFGDAVRAQIAEPNAMVLATVGPDGQPSQRTVLMKYLDAEGVVFFTNYESRKAREIVANPRVCGLFLWTDLERQVQVRGTAERVSHAESLRYFMRRPRESRIGAWVSHQSEVISSRSVLETKFNEMKQKFSGGEVPLPSFWGGYRLRPDEVEIWQGRKYRLHDRFLYTRTDTGWQAQRLAP